MAGFDGCNLFSDSFDPESGERGQLVDGVLSDLGMGSDDAACPDQPGFGPTPMDRDLLRLVDDGERLEVVRNDRVQVQLIREP